MDIHSYPRGLVGGWTLSSSRQHSPRSYKVNSTGPKLLSCLPFSSFCNQLPLCPCGHLLILGALHLRVPPTTFNTDMTVLARVVFAYSLLPVPACGPEVSRLKKVFLSSVSPSHRLVSWVADPEGSPLLPSQWTVYWHRGPPSWPVLHKSCRISAGLGLTTCCFLWLPPYL